MGEKNDMVAEALGHGHLASLFWACGEQHIIVDSIWQRKAFHLTAGQERGKGGDQGPTIPFKDTTPVI
jgi:hypothetical protein